MEALGFNLFLFLSQLINFVAMIIILNALLYKPVRKMLNERTARIEQSMKEAEQVQTQMQQAKSDYEAKIAEARQEAARVLAQAQERARTQEAEIVAQARQDAERIREEAYEQSEREREQLLLEVKDQLADLVALTASRVLEAEVSASTHARLIDESLAQLGRQN